MLPFPGQQIIALSLLELPQKIKYWTPLRFWACVSMVCACVFTDNKELILSLSLSSPKPLRIYFLEMVNGLIQSGLPAVVGRTNWLGQTALQRTVTLRNGTVRSDYRLRRQQLSNDQTPMNHIHSSNFKLGYVQEMKPSEVFTISKPSSYKCDSYVLRDQGALKHVNLLVL